MLAKPLPGDDLDAVVKHAQEIFSTLHGGRLFVTGGTGFFGHWLVESLLHANRMMRLEARVTLLTRNAGRFRAASPWVTEDAAVTLLEGDIRRFEFPAEAYTHVIHTATDSGGQQDEGVLAEEIVEGTRRVIAFAKQAAVQRLLCVSSGAVYGREITDVERIEETHSLGVAGAAYDVAKRAAERLCFEGADGIEAVVARCFAFVGPRLPLDTHFAIGNFVKDAMGGRAIHIKGDGTPLRSYLYMSDLAVWLWTMLVRGEAGRAYNVGSDEGVSIAELARLVAETLKPGLTVHVDGIAQAGAKVATYVPSVERARKELGLSVTVGLREAIAKTAIWYDPTGE